MNKLIITKWKGRILTVTLSDGQVVQLYMESDDDQSILNNIYIGKVKNILKNINSAFVDIGNGRMGYYSLSENPVHHYARPQDYRPLRAGDEIIVQVSKDAVKTKAPVLSSNLNFIGRTCVLTAGKNQIGFSGKITDDKWKKRLKLLLEQHKDADFGIIVRTNAAGMEADKLLTELERLKTLYHQVLSDAQYRTCYSLLYRADPVYMAGIRDSFSPSLEEILTDDAEIYQNLSEYLSDELPSELGKLRIYQDELLPVSKLYNLDTVMERALGKRVWLKSGGYLVIEPTEALTVIDVNTGKYAGKKKLRDTIMKINSEAAAETAKQLRLRNLSGIIIIDFIDMEFAEDRQTLLNLLTDLLSKDPVKATVVDMTKLNLVEVTRKKLRKPLHEQIL